jgi:hypothetical protein
MYALFIDVGFNADKHNVPIPKKRDEFGKQGEGTVLVFPPYSGYCFLFGGLVPVTASSSGV